MHVFSRKNQCAECAWSRGESAWSIQWTEENTSWIGLKLLDEMRNFPLRSTWSEHLFAFSASVLSLFLLGANFLLRVVSRSGNTVDNRLFSSSACWFVRKTHRWSFTRKVLYYLFDITVHLSSFPFKATLCRMLGLFGLVAFAEIHLTGFISFGKCRQH